MTMNEVNEASESHENEEGGANPDEAPRERTHHTAPRMIVGETIEIDHVREQLENHGRVVLLRSESVYVPDRSVNLLTRALRVPRVPRSNGPTHFTIPRHVDRNGTLLESTEQWDPINWRTRACRPQNTHALLIAKASLRALPQQGKMTWQDIELALKTPGINSVYEPLAVAMIREGETVIPRSELYTISSETGGSHGKKGSRLLDMAAMVFRGKSNASHTEIRPIELVPISDETRTKWHEKLTALGINKPYIIAAPFGMPSEGVQDWAVEKCAEVLRHAHEWRQVQSVIVCSPSDRGKAERLRIISGSNIAQIVCDPTSEEISIALSEARATLATPGQILLSSIQQNVGTVCITGSPASESISSGAMPHFIVRPGSPEGKVSCDVCLRGEHACLEDLDAGSVARALSKVLTAATPH